MKNPLSELHFSHNHPMTMLLMGAIVTVTVVGSVILYFLLCIRRRLTVSTGELTAAPSHPPHVLSELISLTDALSVLIYLASAGLLGVIAFLILSIIKDRRRFWHNMQLRHDLFELNTHLESRVDKALIKSRRQEEILQQRARLAQMGEMVTIIAHQWRQPLTAIASTADLLTIRIAKDRFEPEVFVSKLQSISEHTHHLSGTINDFRSFFNADKNAVETTFPEIVEKSIGMLGDTLKNSGIRVETHFECGDDGKLITYVNEIRQVVINVIKNAEEALVEAGVASPLITIRSGADDESVRLCICDNAGGIASDQINIVFDSFFTTKEEKGGTGLGLYIAKMIIEEHCGGRLIARNEGDGACFEISLPSSKQLAASDSTH